MLLYVHLLGGGFVPSRLLTQGSALLGLGIPDVTAPVVVADE